jgi:pyrroline-5-carboxylate reductase
MGGALLSGWTEGRAARQFFVVEPAGLPARFASLPEIFWHRSPGTLPAALDPDAVVLAVKPQIIDQVLGDYRRWAGERTLFLSIVAGKTIAGLARHLGAAAIVRSMPNTPAAIARAITVACANPRVSEAQRGLCERLLAAIGESAWVEDESLMDAVTALSGSGPAYVFLLIEALAQAGEKEGLARPLAWRLAKSTVAGAGELARLSPEPPAELRRNVTSPGGTTEAALAVLMAEGGLPALMERAVAAAARRSRELAL